MSRLLKAWENERINYQQRYAYHARKYAKNENDNVAKGQMLEASYVLINVFGLTDEQVDELEQNNFCGLTKKDLVD